MLTVTEPYNLTPLGQEMVLANTGLAYSVAWRKGWPGHLDADERVSIALEALIKAVVYFDTSRGFKFSTYATWAISNTIRRATLKHRVIRVCPQAYDADATDETRERADCALTVLSLDAIDAEPAAPEDRELVEPAIIARLLGSIDCLPDRTRRVIRERMAGRTLRAIAAELAITKERVRQLEGIGKRRIHRDLAGAMGFEPKGAS